MNEPNRKHKCLICGDRTHQPIRAVLHHFRLVEWDQWQYWRGNIRTFGFWNGLRSSVTLSFPILNTLIHWRYRKATLSLANGEPRLPALPRLPMRLLLAQVTV